MEAHAEAIMEDSGLIRGPSPLPCQFGGTYCLAPLSCVEHAPGSMRLKWGPRSSCEPNTANTQGVRNRTLKKQSVYIPTYICIYIYIYMYIPKVGLLFPYIPLKGLGSDFRIRPEAPCHAFDPTPERS